jgi:hypothetical protein
MKEDYSDRSIYKSLQLKNDCIVLNNKTIIKKNIYLQSNIITASNKTIDPENLNLIQRVNNDSIVNNKVVIYGKDGGIKTENLTLSNITFGSNTLKLPNRKGSTNEFLSIGEDGHMVWTQSSKAGINSLNSLIDVTVSDNKIILGDDGTNFWLPKKSNVVDLGTVNHTFKDIYCRRIITNNNDVTSMIGRCSIGYCGKHNYASFSHSNSNNINNIAIGQDTNGKTTLNCSKNQSMNFTVDGNNKMIIHDSGQISIGTNLSNAKVTIDGTINQRYKHYTKCINQLEYSLFVESGVLLNDSIYKSCDKRDGKDIVEYTKNEALHELQNINFIKYNSYDKDIHYSFNFDNKSNKIKQFIPNIYEMCKFIKNGNNYIIILNEKDTDSFLMNTIDQFGNQRCKLKLKKINGDSLIVNVVEIIDSKKIRIDTDLLYHVSFIYDDSNKIIKDTTTIWNNNIFVYGQEVDDYNVYNQTNLSTLTTIAVKELDANLQETNNEIQKLTQDNISLNSRLNKLEQILRGRDRILNKT